jgi:phosphatidylglycerol---prolipoprotein diacylglyceryl transferase
MNPIAFQIGPFSIKWYSLMILLGVIAGIGLLLKEGKKYNYPKDFLFNLCFWAIIFGFIGARIYYVLFNFDIYKNDPVSIFKIWEGGLAIHGGLIAGFITIYFYCKKYNVRLLKITDMAVPGILLAQSIGRWGNFFNMEAHGGAVLRSTLENLHLPEFIINGMNINGVYYHPTFFYESIMV